MEIDLLDKQRYKADKRLRLLGKIAITISIVFLVTMFLSIILSARSAFVTYEIKVDLSSTKNLQEAQEKLDNLGSDIFSLEAEDKIKKFFIDKPEDKIIWLPASAKLNYALLYGNNPSSLDNKLIKQWQTENKFKRVFNLNFFTHVESREPEIAGILTSLIGSFYTILVCFIVSVPISLCSAIYLEEFAPKNLITTLIEININNLAAIPSIVFGLLGLAILINFFDLPRSASVTAGITLAMMTMPTMIITTRQAIRSIPSSIKQAALALGATKMQIIIHHILPCALPGIMTGIILSISRAIGETAPLILIGMVAFIVDIPHNILDPATVIPTQIFLWADSPEQGFQAKASAAILVLLGILILLNMAASYIRKKYEHKW